jgi:hypothetical protein
VRAQLQSLSAYNHSGCVAEQMCAASCGWVDVEDDDAVKSAALHLHAGGALPSLTSHIHSSALAWRNRVRRVSAKSPSHQKPAFMEVDSELESEMEVAAAPKKVHQQKKAQPPTKAKQLADLVDGMAHVRTNEPLRARLQHEVAATAQSRLSSRAAFDALSSRQLVRSVNKVSRNTKVMNNELRARLQAQLRNVRRHLSGSVLFLADQMLLGRCHVATMDSPMCGAQCALDDEADTQVKQLLATAGELAAARRELNAVAALLGDQLQSRFALNVALEFASPNLQASQQAPSSVDLTVTLLLPGVATSFVQHKVDLRDPRTLLKTLSVAVAAEVQCLAISQLGLKVLANGEKQCAAQRKQQASRPQTCPRPGVSSSFALADGLLFDKTKKQLVTDEALPSEKLVPSRVDLGVFFAREQTSCPAGASISYSRCSLFIAILILLCYLFCEQRCPRPARLPPRPSWFATRRCAARCMASSPSTSGASTCLLRPSSVCSGLVRPALHARPRMVRPQCLARVSSCR